MLSTHVTTPFWRRHPLLCGAAVIVAGLLVIEGYHLLVAVAALLVLTIAIRRHRRAAELRDAGLRARAELEHRLALAGDPRGIYGRYPPVQAGWFTDPRTPCQFRYFDGAMWTGYVAPR